MRISDWSSDVCSSDLRAPGAQEIDRGARDHIPDRRSREKAEFRERADFARQLDALGEVGLDRIDGEPRKARSEPFGAVAEEIARNIDRDIGGGIDRIEKQRRLGRSEEHTSELQSLMRISYAVYC